ncbi:MAG: porin [Methylobacterium sp.]|nr:porin [Methylobacterium sp.]
MKLVKSLLLGSAAGLVAVAGASAADLGVKKPTAVEYVKTCPQYGAGFFVVPGTTSCLKIIGRVRAEAIFNNPVTKAADGNTFRVRGYFGYDHRTATEYGLLRTLVRGYLGRDNNIGGAIGGVNASNSNAVLEYAFIQFGGLTVGRITPVWEHGYSNSFYGSNVFGGFSDISYINSFGYTLQFGGGFSATVALDSARERQVAVTGGGGYAGQRMPDIVGSLDYAGSWGAVKLAGAIHEIRAQGLAGLVPSAVYGFAIGLNGKINLPMISQGSNIWANVVYADGASSYAGFASSGNIGNRTFNFDDAVVSAGSSSLSKTQAWALAGGLEIFAAPTIRLGLYGSYGRIDPKGASNNIDTYSALAQVAWLPVPGFLIGAEGGYIYARGGVNANSVPLGTTASPSRSQDQWVGRIRFQRDF